jgi:hypothetical protein
MRREKTQINEIRNSKREITRSTMESRESSETTLRNYILTIFKVLMKWTNV